MDFNFFTVDQIVNFTASCIIIVVSIISLIYMSVKKMKNNGGSKISGNKISRSKISRNKISGNKISKDTLITLIVLACFISLLGVSAWKLSQYVYLKQLDNLRYGKNPPPGIDKVLKNLGHRCTKWGYISDDCIGKQINASVAGWSVSVAISSIVIILCFAKLAGLL